MTTPRAPKYRTDTLACSCPGFWYRRTCNHFRAYREALALVLAQNAANVTWARQGAATGLCVALSATLSSLTIPAMLAGMVKLESVGRLVFAPPTVVMLAGVGIGQPPTPAMFASIG